MSDEIPLSVPSIRGNEWKYIKECLDTEWVSSSGKYVELFENKIAEFTGAKYAIACVNGTAALHISLLLSGVEPDDEVIVPTLTFIAPVNAIRYCGAHPVFMDADQYYNIDCAKTIEFIRHHTSLMDGCSRNQITGRRIKAVIPVHVFGNGAALSELLALCKERNISVIEDATESLGTRYHRDYLGGKHTGTLGTFGCLSFNGNKIITTGGGGMILTNDEKRARQARYLTTQAKDDEVQYIHNHIGYNYRLTNIQAALGVAQLEQLSKYLEVKKRNYLLYKESIDRIHGLHLAEVPEYADSNYWMYALQIDRDLYGAGSLDVMNKLSQHSIQTRPVWHLNHLQNPYKDCQTFHVDRALTLHARSINLPCSVNLRTDQIQKVIELLKY